MLEGPPDTDGLCEVSNDSVALVVGDDVDGFVVAGDGDGVGLGAVTIVGDGVGISVVFPS